MTNVKSKKQILDTKLDEYYRRIGKVPNLIIIGNQIVTELKSSEYFKHVSRRDECKEFSGYYMGIPFIVNPNDSKSIIVCNRLEEDKW